MGAGILCFLSKSLTEGITFSRRPPSRLRCQDWEGRDLWSQRLCLLPVASRGWRSCLDRRRCWDSKPGAGYDRIECLRVPTLLSCYRSHDFRQENFELKVAPILIRQGTWIAIGSLVVAGVTIGEGAVVSAGSVVLRDVPGNCLVRGNPAQMVYEIFRDPGGAKAAIGVTRPHFSKKSISPPGTTARALEL
jgi:Bacterial transferase hexapeptide (six repeats)